MVKDEISSDKVLTIPDALNTAFITEKAIITEQSCSIPRAVLSAESSKVLQLKEHFSFEMQAGCLFVFMPEINAAIKLAVKFEMKIISPVLPLPETPDINAGPEEKQKQQ